MREELVGALARRGPEGLPPLARALDAPSARLRERITYALAGSPAGAQLLVDAVRAGRLPAQALADPTLRERLVAGKPESDPRRGGRARARRFGARGVRDAAASTRITRRFDARAASAEQGSRVFATNCSACHSARGQGGQVGPQLDGVGHRAPADLLAKVLAPNRNVAPAFRYETVILKNGDVFTGLYRREQGVSLAFVDRRWEGGERAEVADRGAAHHAVHADAEQLHGRHSRVGAAHLVAYLGTLR